jgi:hypothetical protein
LYEEVKYLFVIFAVSGILLQNINKIIVLLEFEMNQEYIAKNLCVEKDVEDNCCQGSCHLKEKLEEEDKKDKDSGNTKENKEVQIFFQNDSAFSFFYPVITKSYSDFLSKNIISFAFSIYHPPR